MKVKCINNKYYEDFLTIGKTYEVIKINKNGDEVIDGKCYLITNDKGFSNCWFEIFYFKPLSEFRNEKIDRLLK